MAALAAYVRHAERFGTDGIFDVAGRDRDLDVMDLGRLNLRLRNLDPKWKAPNAGAFALRLLAAGADDADACRMAGVNRSTLWRLKREVQEPNQAPEPAFQSGGSVANRASEGNTPGVAVLAAGGDS